MYEVLTYSTSSLVLALSTLIDCVRLRVPPLDLSGHYRDPQPHSIPEVVAAPFIKQNTLHRDKSFGASNLLLYRTYRDTSSGGEAGVFLVVVASTSRFWFA